MPTTFNQPAVATPGQAAAATPSQARPTATTQPAPEPNRPPLTAAQEYAGYVPLAQTALWWLLIVVGILVLRRPLIGLLDALAGRVRDSGSLVFGPVALGRRKKVVTNTADAPDDDLVGNPNRFQLLFKAQSATYTNSTKAMQLPTGCLVQITNEQRQRDGAYFAAESLAFVPGVVIVDEASTPGGDPEKRGRYLARAGDGVGRAAAEEVQGEATSDQVVLPIDMPDEDHGTRP